MNKLPPRTGRYSYLSPKPPPHAHTFSSRAEHAWPRGALFGDGQVGARGRPAWQAFVDADEIESSLSKYESLRRLYQLPPRVRGLDAFDALVQRAGAVHIHAPHMPLQPPRAAQCVRCQQRAGGR